MRVVVTGGAGFIGANLTRKLVADHGSDVVVLDDLSTGSLDNLDGVDADVRIGSILDPVALSSACDGADAIVHLAARPSVARSIDDPSASHEANATGTLRVLEAARVGGSYVAIASSSSVYGANTELPKRESATPMPLSPYAVSKLAAESYTIAYQGCFGLRTLAFRFFNVYGPLQAAGHAYAAVIPAFLDAALRSEPLTLHGDGLQTRDFTYVDTVTDVICDAVVRRVSHDRPVNLAFGSRTSLRDLVKLIERAVGRRLAIITEPPRAGDVRDSQADNEVLRRIFPNITAVNLERGLEATLNWFRSDLDARRSSRTDIQ